MDLQSELARERRARLAAERLLSLRQQELHQANAKLGLHANALTEEIVEKREEAIELRDQTDQALQNLEKAQTEVHIAKRRLWDSIETIEDGFAVFDKDDRMIIANSAYLSIFEDLDCVGPGISYPELALLMIEEGIANIGDMAPMEWVDQVLDRWRQPQPAPQTIELWNGTNIKLVDRRSNDGDTVSLALNITDTIRYERKLKRASHRAQAASRVKSAFLARMSHELRTPMNGVLGMAELLSETTLDDEQQLYIETIRSSSEALLQLINDVLDFSKMEAARLTLKPAEFDLEQLVLDVMRLFKSSKREKGLELVVDYDIFLPTSFVADAGRLRQVLTNLLGNAVKFTENGKVEIKITGVPKDDAIELHLLVTDTGIGIPRDKIKHVFGEFNQVEDEKNRKFEGTGLGLAITRQIVELMGGEIWVDSVEGEGSSFGVKVDVGLTSAAHLPPPSLPLWAARVVTYAPASATATTILAQLARLGIPAEVLQPDQESAANDVLIIDGDAPELPQIAARLEALAPDQRPRLLAYSDALAALEICGQGQETLSKPFGRQEMLDAVHRLRPPDHAPVHEDLEGAQPGPMPPKAATKVNKPDLQAALEVPMSGAEHAPRKMRILAAEDNKTNRLVMQKLLKSLNIELEFAENGELAVAAWERFKPDLVLMDISMPIMDGKQATRAIRDRAAELGLPHTPIVAVTAHAVEGDKEEILNAGLDHYLTKPLKKQAIFDRIRVAMPEGAAPVFPDEEPETNRQDPPDGTKDMESLDGATARRDDAALRPEPASDTGELAAEGSTPQSPPVDLASTAPTVLGRSKSEPLQRLSEALTGNPAGPPGRPVSQALGQAQDMWNSLATTQPQVVRAES